MTSPSPRTAGEFLRLIGQACLRDCWQIATEPADRGDPTAKLKIVFWLASDPDRLARVEHSHGRLIVSLLPGWDMADIDYWFDLNRLHEDWPRWTWKQQIEEKTWQQSEHFELLDRLCELIPPPDAATHPSPRNPALANHVRDEQ